MKLAINGLALGFLPQTDTLLAPLNTVLKSQGLPVASSYGVYAQTYPGVTWNGSQLLDIMSDVAAAGAVFEPVIMPMYTWEGYTAADNSQAVAIAQILGQFTSIDVEVRLRFAHEANWYSTAAGGYIYGNNSADPVADFKTAFATVYAACQRYSPEVHMVYSPNIANLTEYELWAPDSDTYDFVSIDYYPNSLDEVNAESFISRMKPFHDAFTANGTAEFIVAEAGLHLNVTVQERVDWLNIITSLEVQEALPKYTGVTWYNENESDYDFTILDSVDDALSQPLLTLLENSTSAAVSSSGQQEDNLATQNARIVPLALYITLAGILTQLTLLSI